ncbi:MAG TPA: carbohydrate binding domain-containing protein [Planctomycetota bacterium]|nr:carbohydrate binding domain-containing protein [Planctomycetota bacterium]
MSERLEALYTQLCEGTLDSAGREELLSLLRDKNNRAALVDIAVYEAVVADELKLAEARGEAEAIRDKSGQLPAVRATRRVSAVKLAPARSGRVRSVAAQKSSSLGWALAAMVLLSLGAMAYLKVTQSQRVDVAVLEKLEGGATVLRGREVLSATAGMALASGDQLQVKGAALSVAYADGTRLALGTGARLALNGSSSAKVLRLSSGKLDANVTPQTSPLRLLTPHSEVTVLGTEFTLEIEKQGTRLEVNVGRVKLADVTTKAEVEVPAGKFAVAGTGKLEALPLEVKLAKLLDDFEAEKLSNWTIFALNKSKIRQKRVTPGKASAGALRVDYEVPLAEGGGGTYYNLRGRSQDWSSYSGVSFWFYGNGTGNDMAFEIMENQLPGRNEDTAERFVYEFKDNFTGWRQITARWGAFKRRNWQPGKVPNDGFTLKQVNGFDFIAGTGSGWFMADQIGLIKD